jgi:hypothetical protein
MRYEIILSILDESNNLTNEEVHFLFSLLDKEQDLDTDAIKLIATASVKYRIPCQEPKVIHYARSAEEIEFLEGLEPCLIS